MAQLLTVFEGKQTNETIYFEMIECANCGSPFMITKRLRENLQKSKDTFYCPMGHGQSYTKSKEEILKERLDSEARKHAKEMEETNNRLLDEINKRHNEEVLRKKSERKLKRVHKGVCSCCNRSFVNLANHMKTKHPDVAPPTIINPLQAKISKK